MTFPLYFLLFPYLLFLLVWMFFSLTAIYHILRFGFKNFITIFMAMLYVGVSAWILLVSYNYIKQIDWDLQISILKGAFNTPTQFFK